MNGNLMLVLWRRNVAWCAEFPDKPFSDELLKSHSFTLQRDKTNVDYAVYEQH
jgi:hypothetical protein